MYPVKIKIFKVITGPEMEWTELTSSTHTCSKANMKDRQIMVVHVYGTKDMGKIKLHKRQTDHGGLVK